MTEVAITDFYGGQTSQAGGFKTLLANVDAWKTEGELGLNVLPGRSIVLIQNLGVEVGGKNRDSAHTLDYCVYRVADGVPTPTSGQYGTVLSFGYMPVLINPGERIIFRSDIENGVCNLIQIEV